MYCVLIPVNSLAKTEVHMWKIKAAQRPALLTHSSDMGIYLFSFTLRVTPGFFSSPLLNQILISCLRMN